MDFETFCTAQVDRIRRELYPRLASEEENAAGTEPAEDDEDDTTREEEDGI